MKALETGTDKIQKICDTLRKETLEPAKQEAREIVENAHMQAAEIVKEAKEKAALRMKTAETEMEEKKKVFHAALNLAARQGLESLKQKIEKELFSQALEALISKEMNDPNILAGLLKSFMHAIEKEGDRADFCAIVSKHVSARTINELLSQKVLERLENQTVVAGELEGGLKIQLKAKKITVDFSDALVKELIGQYIRKDLRDLVFGV